MSSQVKYLNISRNENTEREKIKDIIIEIIFDMKQILFQCFKMKMFVLKEVLINRL